MKELVRKLVAIVLIASICISGLTVSNANKTVVQAATTDILFIGNSMTYYNELQDIFEALATKMGKDVNCTAATNGGQNLIYQSTANNVVTAIKKGGYEIVVIQDVVGSFNADNLMTGARNIINTIHQYNPNAQIVFYGPWPRENVLLGSGSRLDYFTQGYINAARATGGVFAPAGEAFYECFVTHGYNYYADGLHPLPMGSFISAATIYYTIYANEGLRTFNANELADLNAIVNVAQGNKKNYTLDEFNNIMTAGHKYARGVAPAVADKSGNTKYTSALYVLEDPSKKVSADLSGFSKINLNNASVIDVSSNINNTNTGDKIIDGNMSTRWETEYADPQYFTIRLDKTYTLNGIKLFWEGAASRKYIIQTSTDNVNWTQVFEQKNGVGGNESIKFENVTNANYVRLYSTERLLPYGVSLFEAELYGSVASGSVDTPTQPEPTTKAPEVTTKAPETSNDPAEIFGVVISSPSDNVINVVWGRNIDMENAGQLYNIYVDGVLVHQNVPCASYDLNASAGTHTVRVTSVLGSKETAGFVGTVTVAGQNTEPEEPTTAAPQVEPMVEINGCQISTTVGGYRVVYSVNNGTQNVESVGMVYGLADYTSDNEMVVGSKNSTVHSYVATEKGKTEVSYSKVPGSQSYAMTMKFVDDSKFYSAGIKVRAYAKLANGSYIYSDVIDYSVYEIADYLYQEKRMNTVDSHDYLYNNILSVVNAGYKKVGYEWNNIIVKPSDM